jgi:hypothetical protein
MLSAQAASFRLFPGLFRVGTRRRIRSSGRQRWEVRWRRCTRDSAASTRSRRWWIPLREGFQNLGSCCDPEVFVDEAAESGVALDLAGEWWIWRRWLGRVGVARVRGECLDWLLIIGRRRHFETVLRSYTATPLITTASPTADSRCSRPNQLAPPNNRTPTRSSAATDSAERSTNTTARQHERTF